MEQSSRFTHQTMLVGALVLAASVTSSCTDQESSAPHDQIETRALASTGSGGPRGGALPEGEGGEGSLGESWKFDDIEFDESTIPPPLVPQPLHECATEVQVRSCLDKALVVIVDESDKEIGSAPCINGTATVQLDSGRQLQAGESIRAVQKVNGQIGRESSEQRVSKHTGPIPEPRIARDVWDCSRLVVVDGGLPGGDIELSRGTPGNMSVVRREPVSSGWEIIRSYIPQGSAQQGEQVIATQSICGGTPVDSAPKSIGAQSPPPAPTKVEAWEGGEQITVRGLLTGAVVETERVDPSPLLHLFSGIAIDPSNWWNSSETIQQHWDLKATQELCSVSNPSNDLYIGSSDELKERISKVEILTPVCPNAPYVEVATQNPMGRIVLYGDKVDPSNYIGAAAAADSPTAVGLTAPLNNNNVNNVYARQELPSGLKGQESLPVPVGDDPNFTVSGQTSHTDQDDQRPIEGFVRETSRGPTFELRECCPAEPVTEDGRVKVDIFREDDLNFPYATIHLDRQYSGVYSGRWDWFMSESTGGPIPPPANYQYVAVVESPCSEAKLKVPFFVLTGEANNSGDSRPLEVSLNVEGAETDEASSEDSVTVSAGEDITISVDAFDRDGVQEVRVISDPVGLVNNPSQKTATETVPVPGRLTLDTQIDGLSPGQITVHAEAKNFGGSWVPTAEINVQIEQEKPRVVNISPSELFAQTVSDSPNTVDIDGDHLFYPPNLTTSVEFCTLGSQPNCETSTNFDNANSSADELVGVEIPNGVVGAGGIYTPRCQDSCRLFDC
ncbi:hypothetical protein FIV42_14445 [Persicimonas caeni]|uniref:Uncharacterized protein n=1 Tax=Persicimonas caeni TaxID=2292766 RepID=A0A4Y6PU91_PERCE|nr:hypothetical protein [Persicimonas caeni]QDG51896.1 hypothetical protein FIV42_14445 [Persicimonas caeni]QED33117.1 hypothetical protein FRD00_14440 [Persicimonas caeni]